VIFLGAVDALWEDAGIDEDFENFEKK